MKHNQLTIKKITLVANLLAIAIAVDIITGLIPGLNLSLPLGGRLFGISLLPIILIGMLLGPGYGITGAVLYGLFGFFNDGYALSYFADSLGEALLVFFLDYIIAFGALGLSGFFKRSLQNPLWFSLTTAIVLLIRWASSTTVGAVLWASYVSPTDEFAYNLLTDLGGNAWLYSGVYNILYTLPTIAIIALIGSLTLKQLNVLKHQYVNPLQ